MKQKPYQPVVMQEFQKVMMGIQKALQTGAISAREGVTLQRYVAYVTAKGQLIDWKQSIKTNHTMHQQEHKSVFVCFT